MQLAAEYWSIDIGYKETKHDEWGYMGKIKFKRRKKFNQLWQGIQQLCVEELGTVYSELQYCITPTFSRC